MFSAVSSVMPDPDPTPEPAWVRGVQAGDVAAFRTIFEAFAPGLVSFARRYVGTVELAEEIVHDVFLRIWELGAEWRPRGPLRPYLYAAVRNRCLDHLRRRERGPEWAESVELDVLNASGAPSDALHQKELQAAAQRAIDAMPERRRLVFVLSRYQGLTYSEIAAVLGISTNTVEVQIVRALKYLRERLGPLLSITL